MAKIDITKTELVWPGKYNEDGTLKEVPRVSLPFQVIETVNATREAEAGWRNKLIWGDNLLVMGSLLEKFAGKIDLIYIDPPFATGADFSFTMEIGESGEAIEEKAYRDTWGRGADSYFSMITTRLQLLHRLLAEDGSIYVHLDYRMASYVRCLMDEIFGPSNLRNEIVWQKCNSKNYTQSSYSNIHDTILFYTKSADHFFADVFEEHNPEYVERSYRHRDSDGRRYRLLPVHAPGIIRRGATGGPWRGEMPLAGNHWRFHPDTLDKMHRAGLIVRSDGGVYAYKKYLDDSQGVRAGTIWLDVKQLPPSEKVDYATQKPETILNRIVEASSRPGALVADFFCGSGTTLAVAEKLGRCWIGCDLSHWGIHATRKRLLGIEGCKAFEVLQIPADVRFFELAYLKAEIKQPKKLAAQVALKDFVIPNTELIPEDVRSKVTKWSDYIDYWAVDWDFRNDTFMQGWVAYRTRKERKLPLASDPHAYEKPGKYRILVKVIDIFGNDTSQAFDVEIK